MYVRLAFAVAAHLEPEILLVDEVLAVGDVRVPEKCLGKMGEVARRGRTVLFVSHNMAAIARLCAQGLWLDRGRIRMDGPARSVVHAYLTEGVDGAGAQPQWPRAEQRRGSGRLRLTGFRILGEGGAVRDVGRRRAGPDLGAVVRRLDRRGETTSASGFGSVPPRGRWSRRSIRG